LIGADTAQGILGSCVGHALLAGTRPHEQGWLPTADWQFGIEELVVPPQKYGLLSGPPHPELSALNVSRVCFLLTCAQVIRVSSTLGWAFELAVRPSSDVMVHDKYNIADFLQVKLADLA